MPNTYAPDRGALGIYLVAADVGPTLVAFAMNRKRCCCATECLCISNGYNGCDLTLQNSVEISYTRFIGNKPLKINLKTTNYSGSKLFGYERSDRSRTINLSIPLTQRFIFTIGVTEMNSSIDYYDSLTPIFGFRYQPS